MARVGDGSGDPHMSLPRPEPTCLCVFGEAATPPPSPPARDFHAPLPLRAAVVSSARLVLRPRRGLATFAGLAVSLRLDWRPHGPPKLSSLPSERPQASQKKKHEQKETHTLWIVFALGVVGLPVIDNRAVPYKSQL